MLRTNRTLREIANSRIDFDFLKACHLGQRQIPEEGFTIGSSVSQSPDMIIAVDLDILKHKFKQTNPDTVLYISLLEIKYIYQHTNCQYNLFTACKKLQLPHSKHLMSLMPNQIWKVALKQRENSFIIEVI